MPSAFIPRPARGPAAVLLAAALIALPACGALAASTSYWKTGTFAHAAAGRTDGTSVLSDGRIVLAPETEAIGVPESQYVWGGVLLGDGDVVLSAGTPGTVYRIRNGRTEVLLSEDTLDFPVIAASPAGEVFVGTAPGGDVYRISPNGSSELFFETGQGYVWSMAYSREHGLIVGTGDPANVYAVSADGEGEIIYQSDESSISALAAFDGTVFAGTALSGRLLDITPGEDMRVLYDTDFEEISAIVRGPRGSVCFAAMSVSMDDVIDDGGTAGNNYGEGAVYMTTTYGGAVELWRSAEAPVTSLGRAGDGALLAGTGSDGLVYSVTEDGRVGLYLDLEGEEVLHIGTGERLVMTVGAPGGAYLVDSRPGRAGTYTSDILDTRSNARWGALTWDADTPSGSGVVFSARSGNTDEPGDVWSDWSEVRGSGGGPMECPPARFLQWRAELRRGSGDSGPTIRSVEAAYLPENLPPVVRSVVVHDPGTTSSQSPASSGSITETLSGGVEVTYNADPAKTPVRDLPLLMRGMRTVSWTAADPNGDALLYDIYVRPFDDDHWKLMEKDVEWRMAHTWDTQTMADGVYRLRVVASDRLDNPESTALTGEAESQPFLIDHTPPRLSLGELSQDERGLSVEGSVKDEASPIAAVEVAVDYGEWREAFAVDGMFDSAEERFSLRIEDSGPGRHDVSVRAFDRAGNPTVVRKGVE